MAKGKDGEPTKLRWEYTEEQKREALKLYAEHGPAEAGRRTGIPRATISKWAQRAGVTVTRAKSVQEATQAAADKAAELREKLKLDCRDRAVDLVGRMAEMETLFVGKDGDRVTVDRATATACRELAVAAGVLIDKAELLDGRATSRNEHRNIDAMDREIERLLSTRWRARAFRRLRTGASGRLSRSAGCFAGSASASTGRGVSRSARTSCPPMMTG